MAMDKSALSSAMLSKIKAAGIKDPADQWKKVTDSIAEAVIEHIKSSAEITIPAGSIIPGTVAQGAGPAAAPNPAPIPINQPPAPPGSIK